MDRTLSGGRNHSLEAWTYLHRGCKFNKPISSVHTKHPQQFPIFLPHPQCKPQILPAVGNHWTEAGFGSQGLRSGGQIESIIVCVMCSENDFAFPIKDFETLSFLNPKTTTESSPCRPCWYGWVCETEISSTVTWKPDLSASAPRFLQASVSWFVKWASQFLPPWF